MTDPIVGRLYWDANPGIEGWWLHYLEGTIERALPLVAAPDANIRELTLALEEALDDSTLTGVFEVRRANDVIGTIHIRNGYAERRLL